MLETFRCSSPRVLLNWAEMNHPLADSMSPAFLALGVIWYVVFLLSTTCHEAAHALAAKLGGDLTAPWRAGVARSSATRSTGAVRNGSIPNPLVRGRGLDDGVGQCALRSVLGTAASPTRRLDVSCRTGSQLHARDSGGAIYTCRLWMGMFEHPDSANFTHIVVARTQGTPAGVATFLSVLLSLNLLLGVFNLLPVPPLDGFGAIGLLLKEDAAGRFQQLGRQLRGFNMIGLLIAWQLFDPIFDPIFTLALRALYPGYGYGS